MNNPYNIKLRIHGCNFEKFYEEKIARIVELPTNIKKVGKLELTVDGEKKSVPVTVGHDPIFRMDAVNVDIDVTDQLEDREDSGEVFNQLRHGYIKALYSL